MTILVAIDPGLSGGMAVKLPGSDDVELYDLGTTEKGREVLDTTVILSVFDTVTRMGVPVHCGIEKQVSAPGQGVVSTFRTGFGFGWLMGALQAKYIPTEVIIAKTWMKHLQIPGGMERSDRKGEIAMRVAKIFPKAKLHGPRGGLKDGRSDALGILHYLMRR